MGSSALDGGWSSSRVLVVGTHSWFNCFELSHFKQVTTCCATQEIASVRSHVFLGHGRGASMVFDSMELVHRLKHILIVNVLPFLQHCGVGFEMTAHYCIHGSRRPIRSTIALISASWCLLARFAHDWVCGSFDTDWTIDILSELVLVDTSGDFLSSSNFVETFEVLIIDFGSFKGLFVVNPFWCN